MSRLEPFLWRTCAEVRTAIEARVSLREAHRVIKVWRALWKVAAAMGYCGRESDPSLGFATARPRRGKLYGGRGRLCNS